MIPDDALERLYAAPLRSFVATRKEIAGALRAGGSTEAAKAVAARSRPPLAAWALNQVARRERSLLERVVECLCAVRRAQLGDEDAPPDPDALRALAAREREEMARVAEIATLVLESDGHAASRGNLDRISQALRGAALSPTGRGELLAGRLDRDYEVPDFASLAALASPLTLAASAGPDPAPRAAIDEARRRAHAEALSRAEEELARATAHAAELAEKKGEAELAIALAHRELELALATLEAAERELARAEDRVSDATQVVLSIRGEPPATG